jgi:hypothetical protein
MPKQEKPRPCPNCNGTPYTTKDGLRLVYVVCQCGVRGPLEYSKHLAIYSWNKVIAPKKRGLKQNEDVYLGS